MKYKFYLVVLLLFALASCAKKEGCTNPDAVNYQEWAEANNGTCHMKSDDFIGAWSVSDTWTGYSCPSGSNNYTVSIQHEYGNFNLKVFGFANLSPSEYVVVTVGNFTTSITISDQYAYDVSTVLWHITASAGTITDTNHISFTYWLDSGAAQKNGSMTCIKL